MFIILEIIQSNLQPIFGILCFLIFCIFLSEHKRNIQFSPIFVGIGIQFILAALFLHLSYLQTFFGYLSQGIMALKEATLAGTSFVFGYIGGGDLPFESKGNTIIFAFQILPQLIVVSALSAFLFHIGIMTYLVRAFSWIMKKTLKLGGALGVYCSAKVFLGQTDAPLLIKPYLANLSRSEMFSVICLGFATTSAAIMGIYGFIIDPLVPNSITHIIISSLITIPGALTLSRIVVPTTTQSEGKIEKSNSYSSGMDAIASGTRDGLNLFLNIIAMLIVCVALVALTNRILELLPFFRGQALSLERLLGFLLAPVAWLMGIPIHEAASAGSLLGIKVILNEFFAFIKLVQTGSSELSPLSHIIMIYALCGFGNISSIGIVIGGIGTLVPEKRSEIISLCFKALIVGCLSSCLSATIVGILLK